jgi:hypothetical protein
MSLAFTHALCQVREFFAVRALLQTAAPVGAGHHGGQSPGSFLPAHEPGALADTATDWLKALRQDAWQIQLFVIHDV